MKYIIIRITDRPELISTLSEWFHLRWGIDKNAYIDSMNEAQSSSSAFPEWYAVIDGDRIIGGAGVIANDFHPRTDLTPNLCALYVNPEHRCEGIAGELLTYICEDMLTRGIDTLYLVTDHTEFYERYGWEYLCAVRSFDEDSDSRIYVKRIRETR